MCSSYWNLRATWTCPVGHEVKDDQLQTHFMGDVGSCLNEYTIGQSVEELGDMTITLDGKLDDFIGSCLECGKTGRAWYDLGARIETGRVVEVWVLPVQKP